MPYELDPRYDADLGVSICQELGVDLKRKISGRVMTSHGDHGHKTACLSINLDSNYARCFSCGFSRSLTGWYWDEFGRSAYADFDRGSLDGGANPFRSREPEPPNFDDPPEVGFAFDGTVAPAKSHPLSRAYLKSRGIPDAVADEARMQFCIKGFTYLRNDPQKKIYFTERLIVPIYEKSKLISIEGRDVKGEAAWSRQLREAGKNPNDYEYKKVLFPRGSSVDTLWRLERLNRNETLYVTEGILDAASLMTCEGTKNATAIFHAIPTERQLYLLKSFSDVVFVPDLDTAGFNTLRALKRGGPVGTRILFIPDGVKDASDVQQGKAARFKSISELVNMGWLEKAEPLSRLDVDEIERVLLLAPIDVS